MDKLIEMYSLTELSKIEGRHPTTIKNSDRYIKVKVVNGSTKAQHKLGITKKDYGVKYIRLKDIQELLKGKVDFNFITKQ